MPENKKADLSSEIEKLVFGLAGKIILAIILIWTGIWMLKTWPAMFAIPIISLVAFYFIGSEIAKRTKYENRFDWLTWAAMAAVVWVMVFGVFLRNVQRYDPDKVRIYRPGEEPWTRVISNHLKPLSFKKGDVLEIWSRDEFLIKPYINPTQSYVDSIQGKKQFSNYVKVIWPEKVPESYQKNNSAIEKTMIALYPGFQFSVSPYKESESFAITFLENLDSLKIMKHPDSLLATSIRFSWSGLALSDVENFRIYLGTFLFFWIFLIASLIYKARVEPRDDSPEAKAKKRAQKMKGKKSKEKETKDAFHEPQLGNAIARTNLNSGVPARVEDALPDMKKMIMNIVTEIERIQASQNDLTSYSGGVIGSHMVHYKDQLLKRVKEAKIADIGQANRLVQELINLRDKTRALDSSGMKGQEEIIRHQIEIAKLEAELYKTLPKSDEDNKKEAIKIRYTPLLRKHQLEAEAERLMYIKNSAKQYENDIKDMLVKAGWGQDKIKIETGGGSFEREREKILNWVAMEKMRMSSGIDLALHRAEIITKIKRDLGEKYSDDPSLVDSIIDEVNRILYEEKE